MTLNKYSWQQKSFTIKFSSCIKQSTLIFETLKEAKEEYQKNCLAMLDFANAYGSSRHNLIHFAMKWSNFPPWLCKLTFCYSNNIFAFVVTKN